MKISWLAPVIFGCALVGGGCGSGVGALLDDGEPDLIPLPAAGFCRGESVVVTLRNQGPSDAGPSTVTVVFTPGGSFQLPAPEIAGGRIATLPPLAMPGECFVPSCAFQVIVDSDNDVGESDEDNNTFEETCPPDR